MADEDMGSSYLKHHMTESQPSREYGGFADRRKPTAPRDSDMGLVQRYGKEVDLSPAEPQTVNRARKGNKG